LQRLGAEKPPLRQAAGRWWQFWKTDRIEIKS